MFVCVLEGVPPELITLPRIRLGGEARPGERERGHRLRRERGKSREGGRRGRHGLAV